MADKSDTDCVLAKSQLLEATSPEGISKGTFIECFIPTSLVGKATVIARVRTKNLDQVLKYSGTGNYIAAPPTEHNANHSVVWLQTAEASTSAEAFSIANKQACSKGIVVGHDKFEKTQPRHLWHPSLQDG
eukprot:1796641-Amphidinium_carterae.1